MGKALAKLGRRDEAFPALRSAVAVADELVGQPARWQARAALGQVSRPLGDEDAATAAYDEAGDLIEAFAATLAPARATRLLTAPDVEEILSLAGRRLAG